MILVLLALLSVVEIQVTMSECLCDGHGQSL